MKFAVIPFLLVLLLIWIVVLEKRSTLWQNSPTDVLILAAHQDDCVILAGDYAIWATRAGKSINIVYLTCGDDHFGSERARERRREAIAAWKTVGVSEDAFYFLDYPQSSLGEGCRMDSRQRSEATSKIEEIVRRTTSGTAIFLAAEGEEHVDHRALREIGLDAIRRSKRKDLLVLEAPEYNNYYSFSYCPKKTVFYILKSLPIISRFLTPLGRSPFPGFIETGTSYHVSEDSNTQAVKLKILRGFASENSDLLEHFFDWRTQFRVVGLDEATPPRKGVYFTFGARMLSPLVIALWITIYVMGFAGAWELAEMVSPGGATILLLLLIWIALTWQATRRERALESRILYLTIGSAFALRALVVSGLGLL